ncbi:MAG TPA: class I SAM-dependent methyltransferase [Acidobacteriota bacterium]|nr:class I SAM-dependent methyltransferase [Acidobacteriota bacterium]
MSTARLERFTYQCVEPLDWFQFRCLLWEALPWVPRQDPDRWQRVAHIVNGTCPQSPPCDAAAVERAYQAMAAFKPAVRELAGGNGKGLKLWTEILYEMAQDRFGQPLFMNLGYVPEADRPQLALEAGDEPFRLFIQLYERLVDGFNLKDKQVLEMGCGSGGGASYLHRYHGPAELTGIDYVQRNIETCRRLHRLPGLSFQQGKAQDLDLPDNHFDAVISLEATGGCPSVPDVMAEARRVLRPGGVFLFADIRPVEEEWGPDRTVSSLHRQIADSGLEIEKSADISPGILHSIDLQESARREALQSFHDESNSLKHFEEIMVLQGSLNYRKLESGQMQYWAFRCRK